MNKTPLLPHSENEKGGIGQKVFNIIKRHPIRCSKTLIGCLLSWKDLLDFLLKLGFYLASY